MPEKTMTGNHGKVTEGREGSAVHGRTNLLLVLGGLLLLLAPAQAQSRAELTGVVTDPSGGVIVDAVVELTRGSERRIARTSDRGVYRFADLADGEYELTVSRRGFLTVTERRRVASGAPTRMDISLEILVTEEVRVGAESRSEASTSSLLTREISGEEIAELPSEPGQLLRRLWELAGATGRPGDLAVYVDGFRQVTRLQPKESIRMIRINANPFAAEFGEPGRARIEIFTKPGSDRFLGEVKFNFNDSALNARHPFAPARAPVQTRNYSAYLGGPIVPSRWSFVVYGGRWEQDATEVVNASVLNPDTLASEGFAAEVVTPKVIDNVWIGTDFQANPRHTLTASFGHTRDEARNQGLDQGVDLPERGYAEILREDLGRLSLTSTPTSRLVNELRLEVSRRDSTTEALSLSPAVIVLDAFSAGGNQNHLFRLSRVKRIQVSNHLTLARPTSTFKVGLAADIVRQRDTDRTGFGGTFVFGADVERDAEGLPITGIGSALIEPLERYRRTLLGLPGYGPSQFWIARGDERVDDSQQWGAWFAQGDWKPSSTFTASYGVRQELASQVQRKSNLSPRVGLAWTPDAKGANILRAGAGIFYHRVPPEVTLDTRKLDGNRQQRLVVDQPSFFPFIPNGGLPDAVTRTPTIYVLDPDLRTPRSLITTLSYDRQLRANLFASLSYSYERGEHLLRTRNINAPQGGHRPEPERGPVLQYESSGVSDRHELVVAVRTNWTRMVTIFGNYTWADSSTDTDGPATAPADSDDLASELGPSSTHRRHRATMGVRFRLPGDLIVSSTAVVSSGRPFNITTGGDNNGDTLFTDRPAFAEPSEAGALVTPFGTFNPRPQPDDDIIPRNFGRGPMELRVDLHLSRGFGLGFGRTRVRLGADVVNVFNRANLANVNGVLTSASFGRARRAPEPRRIEFNLGVSF